MNCSQHIHRRFPQSIVGPLIEKLQGQIRELEDKVAERRQNNEADD